MLALEFLIPGTEWYVLPANLVIGAVDGLQLALFAVGLVLMYRVTGVINFAHLAIGAFNGLVMAVTAAMYGVPYWLSLFLTLLSGAICGLATEFLLIRRVFRAPRLVLFIATIGIGQLFQLFAVEMPQFQVLRDFPVPVTGAWDVNSDIRFRSSDLVVLIVVPVVLIALWTVLNRTRLGLLLSATTDNSDTARLYGMSPKLASTITWTICGLLTTIGTLLYIPTSNTSIDGIVSLASPSGVLLFQVLAACVFGKFRSYVRVVVASIIIGVVSSVIKLNSMNPSGFIAVLVLAALLIALMPKRWGFGMLSRTESKWTLATRPTEVPDYLRSIWWIKRLPLFGYGFIFLFLALIPLFTKTSFVGATTQVIAIALMSMSLSLLTGWGGLLSLGQAAFAGIGGMTMVGLMLGHPIPFTDTTLTLHWVPAVLIGVVVAVIFSVIVGLPALRVQGLMLTVVTLGFAVATGYWLLQQPFFLNYNQSTPTIQVPDLEAQMNLFGIDMIEKRQFYYVALAVLALVCVVVAHLRKTGIGRNIIAVRENEDMAATTTVSPTRMKLLAFATAGGIAGLGGAIYMTSVSSIQAELAFSAEKSITLLATSVIGGLGTVGGPILGALWTEALPRAFNDNDTINLLTSSIGLLILVMYFPGGFMQLGFQLRDAIVGWAGRRYPAPERERVAAAARTLPHRDSIDIALGVPLLVANDVRVTFGGVNAVGGVSVTVGQNEIVGLIGANGAGKSTFMNAVSGLVKTSGGSIEAFGTEIAHLPTYKRHGRTLGRGYQAARLYPDLTVRETILVALEAQERTPYFPALLNIPPYRGIERKHNAEAAEIIDFLGLGRYADQHASNLSTGTRRIVEFGCLLAMSPKLILLDEPTGGVAQKETEAFGPLIRRISKELGASVMIIEHDMPLVMSVSDRMYCLETGLVIAEGTPAEVRNNSRVIASYLGTDERAIQRSGSGQ